MNNLMHAFGMISGAAAFGLSLAVVLLGLPMDYLGVALLIAIASYKTVQNFPRLPKQAGK